MITIIIIVITSLISFLAFNNRALLDKLIFYSPAVKEGGWYRFFSYGLLHADLTHLFFNMFTLYLFGRAIEDVFVNSFGSGFGVLFYLLLYILGLPASILPSYIKEKNNNQYRSLGASGAVSAIVFSYMLIYPMQGIGLLFIPIYLPAFLFGIIYIAVSVYLEKKQAGNINHLAHITGGVFGILFMFTVFLIFGGVNIFSFFINNIQVSSLKDLIQFGR